MDEFLSHHELDDLEHDFCANFVTNPRAGEIVKGHAIVLAELGLCPYRGKAPRDPDLFSGSWSRPRRASHLLWRLAFTHELWRHLGSRELVPRAAATDGALVASRPATFVSATFSREVAEAQFTGRPTTRVAVLFLPDAFADGGLKAAYRADAIVTKRLGHGFKRPRPANRSDVTEIATLAEPEGARNRRPRPGKRGRTASMTGRP